ncbi:MAG: AmmeMemoRadiSam system radical SAM enzyme [Deltaproteobacteria bacterium]|nr:AmmeMemoRadiSam system radical SAM enzyme [Deltaproteobacteria bacterium]
MREARLWKTEKDDCVLCLLCAHHCRLKTNERGRCGVRLNQGGKLVTLADRVPSMGFDPVEKKPLFHFLPGTTTLSFGTMGCNFSCLFCQNSSLSQTPKLGGRIQGDVVEAESLVALAGQHGARSISYTYSEPTIFFELMQDTALKAKEAGMANIMVSNGFQSPQCLEALDGLIDAANIDLKAFTDTFYRDICDGSLKPVLRNLKHIREMGWHLEVTTLLIPGLNDSDKELGEMANFIGKELGPDVPWHISGFYPTFKMMDRPPTPLETLERARRIGQKAGLWFVYHGNRHGRGGEDTICPGCGKTVMSRSGFTLLETRLKGSDCSFCGHRILAAH